MPWQTIEFNFLYVIIKQLMALSNFSPLSFLSSRCNFNETWYLPCPSPSPLQCLARMSSEKASGSINRKDPFLGSGSYLLLLCNKVLGLSGNNNNLNFPLTESWWNLEELFFWHKFLPKCCLHPLLRLVWNETLCGRRPPSIRTSWELRWSLELMITL